MTGYGGLGVAHGVDLPACAVTFHDFPETGGVRDGVVAGPLPVALIPGLDNALLHLKPKAEECFQLGDSDGTGAPRNRRLGTARGRKVRCSRGLCGLGYFGGLHGTVCRPG